MRKYLIVALSGMGGLYLLQFLYHHHPSHYSFYPPCVFKWITGYECPGCGSTRALYELLHGNILRSFQYNALFMSALIGAVLWWMLKEIKHCPIPGQLLQSPRVWIVWILLFWLLRLGKVSPFYTGGVQKNAQVAVYQNERYGAST
ncbi:MAG TPA: DUF2752 domain-containing protein [Chitinophagaceae bacterium]|nr:DUF2752 domain-containing protein [Chitinophagaceae bacterium]